MHSNLYVEKAENAVAGLPEMAAVIASRDEQHNAPSAKTATKQSSIGVGKLALGVFLGNLMFGAVAALVYALATAK